MKWTEEMIREEIKRLDAVTGLNGQKLPIRMGRAKTEVGSLVLLDKEPVCFRFSRCFFEHPDFARKSAVETIRHEYAHYMDVCRQGTSRHDKQWEDCCFIIGLIPEREFSPLMNMIYLANERGVSVVDVALKGVPFAAKKNTPAA